VKYLLLDLLQRYKDETTFDPKCKVIVVRRMIEQSHDYRFNPLLLKGCHIDIAKFCSGVVAKEPQDKELEGKVDKCLKVRIFSIFIFLHVISLHDYVQLVCVLLSQALTFQGPLFLLCCNIKQ
jgi:Fe2+ transport system protein B